MIELSVSAEGLFGLTWPAWKRLVRTVEDLGFAGLYLSDHFILNVPPDCPSLELIVVSRVLVGLTAAAWAGRSLSTNACVAR